MNQMSFDFGQAGKYMAQMFVFEERRAALNEEIGECRKIAKDLGVPTKAVEKAIKVARAHAAALELVSQEDFDMLLSMARKYQEQADDIAEITG